MKAALPMALALVLATAGTASADGHGAGAAASPAAASFDWTGGYIGVRFGAATGEFGNENDFPGDGEGDVTGSIFGVSAGHLFQMGQLVYGAELNIASSTISGSESCVFAAFDCNIDVESVGSLRARAGIVVGDYTLLHANAGLAAASVDVHVNDGTGPQGTTSTANGYTVGIGVEQILTPSLSATFGIQHYGFVDEDYFTDVLYQDVDVDFTTFEVGVNFRF